MKSFIVFCGACMIMVSAMAFIWDMNNYTDLRNQLKALSEECSGSGAMMLDEGELSSGHIKIDGEMAKECIEEVLEKQKVSCPVLSRGKISYSYELLSDTAILVTLTYTPGPGFKLFRLPFFDVESLSCKSLYRWENNKKISGEHFSGDDFFRFLPICS